jgi:D-alanyl-D-alanine carboxypeptidase/D-alanyl-D-alanine-endopeptidase (penicillin-binding protein 4)
VLAAALLAAAAASAVATPGAAKAAPAAVPEEVRAELRRAGVPDEALAFVVQDVASGRTLREWQADLALNPASLAKLVTTQAALERLGPAWTWVTPVWLQGTLGADGVFEGHLHLKGSGDPKLVHERLWLLLRRVMQLGVREIRGDIVLDNSAFAVPDTPPGEFDGEAMRPYNVRPAALLLNYRAVIYTFTPDAAAGVARVGVEPALARSEVDRTVPLSPGACNDWRGALDARFGGADEGTPTRVRFAGRYPAACGEQTWALADARPASYDQRLLEGLWREMGGTLGGRVREGPAPATTRPTFEHRSPPLAEAVRDLNKFSNNVMSEQLALTMAREAAPDQPATPDAARVLLQQWLRERLGARGAAGAVLSNASGLSRDSRLSPRQLSRLLVLAHAAPTMPELMASLPVTAVDGTARRLRAAAGRAHLKTGSLRDVYGLAGYVLAADGRRLAVAAIINHPQANAARGALEALLRSLAPAVSTEAGAAAATAAARRTP